MAHTATGLKTSAGLFRTSFPTWRALVLATLVCVVAPFSLIALHIHENPRLSPIDEAEQFDYISRIANASIPRLGQSLLPSTLRLMSCHGSASPARLPPCKGSHHPADYPGGGYQYEAQQPPTYYAIAVPLRWVGVHVFGLDRLTAARATGALWLSAGLLLLWMTGRLMGVAIRRLVPAMLLLSSAPVVIYQSSIVSNDAPSIFAGSLIALLSALAWKRPGRWTIPTLALGAVLVTTIKAVDIIPPLVFASLLAILYWKCADPADLTPTARLRAWFVRWGPNGGVLLLGGVIGVGVWVIVSHELSLINPKTLPTYASLRIAPIDLATALREALSALNPLNGSFSAPLTNAKGVPISSVVSANLQPITGTLLQYLLLAGGLAGLFVKPRKWVHWMGLLALFFAYIVSALVAIGFWQTYAVNPELVGRYALSAAPLLALALVVAIRGRWVLYGLWTFSLSLFGLSFFYLLSR
jgi:hypothetical protein